MLRWLEGPEVLSSSKRLCYSVIVDWQQIRWEGSGSGLLRMGTQSRMTNLDHPAVSGSQSSRFNLFVDRFLEAQTRLN